MDLNLDDDAMVMQPKKPRGWVPWMATLLVAGGGATYAVMQHQAHIEDSKRTAAALVEAQKTATSSAAAMKDLQAKLDEANTKLASTQADLERSTAQKTDDDKLIGQLKSELGGGNGDVAGTGGAITVTMVDKILFKPGEAEMTTDGETVLKRLGAAIRDSGKLVEVSGHADNTPVKSEIEALYPTNWELSAARATHVVRFLAEQANVPPRMLKASGYGSSRPVGSNATPAGRAKNRRIEILLLPDKVKVVKGELPQSATASAAPTKKPGAPEMSDKDRIKALAAATKTPAVKATPAPAKKKKK